MDEGNWEKFVIFEAPACPVVGVESYVELNVVGVELYDVACVELKFVADVELYFVSTVEGVELNVVGVALKTEAGDVPYVELNTKPGFDLGRLATTREANA